MTAKSDRRRRGSRPSPEAKANAGRRDQREPDEADRVGDRPRVQRRPRSVCGRRRAGAVEARQPAERQPRLLGGLGARAAASSRPRAACAAGAIVYGRLATAPPPPRRRPPAARSAPRARGGPAPRPRPRPRCACRPSAAAARRAARRRRTSRPGRRRGRRRGRPGRPRAARRRAARRRRARRCPACPRPTRCDVARRDRARPGDALLVGVLLDGGGGDPRRADAVGAHPDQLLLAGLVEVGRAERLRVARAELEDVADLDRGLDPDRAARRPCRPPRRCARRRARTAKSRPGLDAAQVAVGAVGAGDVARRGATPASSRIGTSAPTGPMKPAGPMRSRDSSSRAGRNSSPSAVCELDLVDAVVAAHEDQHEPAPLGDTGKALSSAPAARPGGRPPPRRSSGRASRPARARRAAPAARPAGPRRWPPRRWRRSRAPARRRSRPPGTAPCTRARRCRPSSRRRTRRGTTPARSGRRCGRRRSR